MSEEEIAGLFATADTTDVLGIRDRCMLEVLYSCALRRTELTNLDVEDVDLGREVVAVHQGNGGKSRVLPLGDEALHWLDRYIEESRPMLDIEPNEHALFISGCYAHRENDRPDPRRASGKNGPAPAENSVGVLGSKS